jgi:hypothetical protein
MGPEARPPVSGKWSEPRRPLPVMGWDTERAHKSLRVPAFFCPREQDLGFLPCWADARRGEPRSDPVVAPAAPSRLGSWTSSSPSILPSTARYPSTHRTQLQALFLPPSARIAAGSGVFAVIAGLDWAVNRMEGG